MEGKRIKWGNIFIFLLIIAAGIAAFYYKFPSKFDGAISFAKSRAETKDVSKDISTKEIVSPSDKFIMGLDSWIGGTPVLIGLSREYNKDYFLSLETEFIPNDGDRIIALKDGKIQATEMSLPSFVRFQSKYPNSGVIVGITDFSRGADGIIAKSDAKTLNDMEGRTVSYVGDGTGKFILNKFLRLTGLRYQDIKPIERKEMGEVISDLKSGKADLAVSWSPDMNLAMKEINALKSGTVKMLISTKEVPNLVPTVLVVNKTVVEKYPKKVEAFLKTWYASSKYIIERPDKAYEKLASLMLEKKDIYGKIDINDVKESFSNIKLMLLNDNFEYFGSDGKEKKLSGIITDTFNTWQKFGDIPGENMQGITLKDDFMNNLYKQKDEELLVKSQAPDASGTSQPSVDDKKEFKKQDAASIEKNTEAVAKVDIPPVYYDSGKATVRQESLGTLNEVLSVLKQFPSYYLIVDAHTDSMGSDEFNLALSRDRAAEVRNYLIAQGVDANRIVSRGWGKYRPLIANEKTEEDRAKNRRTEFILSRDITGK
ncbi:MAG: cell envelope biosis protein OmpA [Clostridiales bacterium]|jgi:outer membrane protein OmpA-like peptidoglycan-associated protein/ABC-type nitrate/sulfonate/bicarbonate transport system substrate-binding protein|nr:cell envelope biosis protein OmpA [Clostridiales bacterium]